MLAVPLVLACLAAAGAELRLTALVSDHAVLQHDCALRLAGRAAPGERLELLLDGTQQGEACSADADGRFELALRTGAPGGPHTLVVRGASEVRVEDVFFGEVWLCAGEIEMEQQHQDVLEIGQAAEPGSPDAAPRVPELRLFDIGDAFSPAPCERCVGRWRTTTRANLAEFSAVAFRFARELQRELRVPVGVIVAAAGGSHAESWVGARGLRSFPGFAPYLERMAKAAADPKAPEARMAFSQDWPSALFNGMIAPLDGLGFAGVLWDQGESNRGQAQQYGALLQALIRDWREHFAAPELPFVVVQLPDMHVPTQSAGIPLVREAQARALALPATALVVTLDLGRQTRGSSPVQAELARRAARVALAHVYGRSALEVDGPRLRAASFEGARVRITLERPRGLHPLEGQPTGFVLAGADRRFRPAEARVEGECVVVHSDAVPAPVAVRYAWADRTGANLVDQDGLPLAPYRSDEW